MYQASSLWFSRLYLRTMTRGLSFTWFLVSHAYNMGLRTLVDGRYVLRSYLQLVKISKYSTPFRILHRQLYKVVMNFFFISADLTNRWLQRFCRDTRAAEHSAWTRCLVKSQTHHRGWRNGPSSWMANACQSIDFEEWWWWGYQNQILKTMPYPSSYMVRMPDCRVGSDSYNIRTMLPSHCL